MVSTHVDMAVQKNLRARLGLPVRWTIIAPRKGREVGNRIVGVLAKLIPGCNDSGDLIVEAVDRNRAVEDGPGKLRTPHAPSIGPGVTVTRLSLVHSS